MAEKINLLRWVFSAEPEATSSGVFFFDSDITFFGSLPTIPPEARVALSPHAIRQTDEAKYGIYNGGFLWIRQPEALDAWEAACETSRFYEQAALEVLARPEWAPHFFPIQSNYGWWRMWQGVRRPEESQALWTIRRDASHSGILVQGAPLLSIHTHWITQAPDAVAFNSFVLGFLKKLSGAHMPAKSLLASITSAATAAQ